MTTLFAAEQLAGSTCHRWAAACTSIARVAAPAWRNGFQKARMELELPVAWMPNIGLAYSFSFGGACFSSTLAEIGIELFGENHRDRGIDALPHLDLRHDQRGLAGMINADESIRRELAVGRVAAPVPARWRRGPANRTRA